MTTTKAIDVTQARADTPGCKHVTHFNNAGSSLPPQPVLDTVFNYLQQEAYIGGYEAAEQADEALEAVYDQIAGLINCHRDEIAVVENATHAWGMAFHSIPFAPGDRILTAKASYVSNYLGFLQMAQRRNVTIDVIPDDEQGQLSVDALQNMMDANVKLIAITHMPTNSGLINPAAAVGKIAKANNTLYLLDACQSVGQFPVDVEAIGCDLLSVTGRKFLRAPRGTGFLYVRETILDSLDPIMTDLTGAVWLESNRFAFKPNARRFETFESNMGLKLGLGAAIAYAQQWGMEAIWVRIQHLANTLRQRLSQLPGVTVHDKGAHKGGIITFTVAGLEATAVKQALQQQKINTSISSYTSAQLDMPERGLDHLVRASVHYYNTEAEIDKLCSTIHHIQEQN